MSAQLNMNEIRRQVYRSYTEDGLIDLAIGLMIFGFGALLSVDVPGLIGVLGIFPLLIWYLGKRLITLPRMGSFQPGKRMKNQLTGFAVSMVALGLGFLALFFVISGSGENIISDHPLALFGLTLGVGISALGLITRTNRLYVYAFLVFMAMAIGENLDKSILSMDVYLLSVMIVGGLILLSGIVVLFNFLKNNPVLTMEE